ncbi:MAG: CRISPR-associated protein Cas4 [Thermoplasmatota archaeon]
MPSAGDVERFVYCAHNWWLAKQGNDGEGGDAGMEAHDRLGEAQQGVEARKRDYRDGMRWSFRILLVAMSVTFLGLELVYLRAEKLHWVFFATALVLVGSSTSLLVIALDAQRRYRNQQKESGLVPGKVVDSDLAGAGRLLHDPEWDLTGRPDYILETPHGSVPVEVKSRSAPDRPFDSHRFQVATYLRLLEANGQVPEYGLLNYKDGVFRIGWDDETRADLRIVVDRLHAAEQSGHADRDHEHPARCAGCARRDACDQRLEA